MVLFPTNFPPILYSVYINGLLLVKSGVVFVVTMCVLVIFTRSGVGYTDWHQRVVQRTGAGLVWPPVLLV